MIANSSRSERNFHRDSGAFDRLHGLAVQPVDDLFATSTRRFLEACRNWRSMTNARRLRGIDVISDWALRDPAVKKQWDDSRDFIRKPLTVAAPGFAKDFQGTDIIGAVDRFPSREPPSLNDLAFLIAIAQRGAPHGRVPFCNSRMGPDYAMSVWHRFVIAAAASQQCNVTIIPGGAVQHCHLNSRTQ
jgi:hypothetical protein